MGEETSHARNILRSSHETDIFQSFVRVELGDESESKAEVKKKMLLIQQQQEESMVETDEKSERVVVTRGASEEIPLKKTSFNQLSKDMKLQGKRKKRIRNNQPAECYTDKDRAAAVNMGSRDIKQSLKMKQREDRTKALMMPDEADPSALIALGCHELRSGDVKIAVGFFNKALECNPEEINALIVRSKCYLILGQPKLALEDAETVFKSDRNNIKAIFQKAEALYHLADFEHSLMYYHRGLRIRPDLAGFRLGVQKTKEAIENTIGISAGPNTVEKRNVVAEKQMMTTLGDKETLGKKYIEMTRNRLNISNPTNHTDAERKNSKRLLGELYLDKEYFENLLKHPDFKCLHKDNEDITLHAKEAIEFLNKRQEFWRQQKPLAIAPQKKK